ncbi:MAG TPA: HAD family hydrolase [Dehalococcoidia bacterium]|nr:HAD family hydrolase [Dehalococcoidia bacterium]
MPRSPTTRLNPSDIRAVVFDAYGTVINFTEPDFIATMAEICADQGIDADAADLWKRFLRASYLMRSEHHHDPVYKRYDQAWADQFEHVFAALKLPVDHWRAALYFKARLADAPAFDDAAPAIEAIGRHYKIGLLSNADDDFLTQCLNRNNLRFKHVLSSEEARAIKPNVAIFEMMARRLRVDPAYILYAGDNPIPDVLGPANAGMRTAWVNRSGLRKPRNIPYPDVRVTSLSELVKILVPEVE